MKIRYSRPLAALLVVALAVVAGACGSGSSTGGSSSSSSSSGGTTVVNSVPVVIDGGPNGNATNSLYASVTICQHGSSSNCQTLDHIQVDTGSYGFRVLSPALTLTGLSLATDAGGAAIIECTQFADGYSWGPVTTVDLSVGGLTAVSVPIQVIGDATFNGQVPQSCSNGLTAEDTVASFGANGILGVGFFQQDCPECASGAPIPGTYYSCPTGGTCTPTNVNLNTQVQNPVFLFASDNNGVAIKLPAVASTNTSTITGTLFFGIGTQSNNQLPNGLPLYAVYGEDCTASQYCPGEFLTTYAGVSQPGFVDTGSNAYFFDDSSVPVCASTSIAQGFYCPPSTYSTSGQIAGVNQNAHSATIDFQIDNAVTLFQNGYGPALPTLGGPATSLGGFDWGLPFFYNRTVFIAFAGAVVSGSSDQGPWVGF